MKYVEDLNFLSFDTKRKDVGELDQHQLSGAVNSAGTAKLWILHELIHTRQHMTEELSSCCRVVLGDVIVRRD